MPDSIEELLDRCLESRRGGASLETILAELPPAARRELEPMLLLAESLRQTPRPGLSAAATRVAEQRLLTRAVELRGDRVVPSAPRRKGWLAFPSFANWRPALVPAATLLLLLASLALIGSGGAIVSNARPDDNLYNLKLTWEQTRVRLSTNDAQRARVLLDIAENRVSETESLALEGRSVPPELVEQASINIVMAFKLAADLPPRDAIPILRRCSELLSYERVLFTRFASSSPDTALFSTALREVEATQESVAQVLGGLVEQQVSGASSPTSGGLPAPSPSPAPQVGRSPEPGAAPPSAVPAASPQPPTAPLPSGSPPATAASLATPDSKAADPATATAATATPTSAPEPRQPAGGRGVEQDNDSVTRVPGSQSSSPRAIEANLPRVDSSSTSGPGEPDNAGNSVPELTPSATAPRGPSTAREGEQRSDQTPGAQTSGGQTVGSASRNQLARR